MTMLLLEKSMYRRIMFKIKTKRLEIPPLTAIEYKGKYYISISEAFLSDEEMAEIVFMTPRIYRDILNAYGAETSVKKTDRVDKYAHYTGFRNADNCERAIKNLILRLSSGKLFR